MEVQAVPREPDRARPAPLDSDQTLVLVFGSPGAEERAEALRELQVAFPQAHIVGCSSTGGPSTTALRFRRVGMRAAVRPIAPGDDAKAALASFTADLARVQPDEAPPALLLVFVRRSGLDAGEILEALRAAVPDGTTLAGGVAGGGEQAWVMGIERGAAGEGEGDCIVGVALHGRDLVVHQHAASQPGTERTVGAAVSLAIGRGAEPPGSDARIVVGGLAPFHGLAEAPTYDDAVITTVHERLALAEDDFDDIETQVTEIPSRSALAAMASGGHARPRAPLPPPPPPPPPSATSAERPVVVQSRPAPRGVERLGFFVAGGWTASLPAARDSEQTLLLVRGVAAVARDSRALRQLGRVFGRSHTVGWCGPAPRAELALEVQLLQLERLRIRTVSVPFAPGGDPEEAGRRVAAQLRAAPGLVAALGVSATPPHAPSRHQAGMASVLGHVPLQVIHGAAPDGDPAGPWAFDGTRLGGAMLVGVGLYREGLSPEAASVLAAEVRGEGAPLEAFWRVAGRLDRPDVDVSEAVLVRVEHRPPPDYEAILARETGRASQADAAAPAQNRPGSLPPTPGREAPVPSSNASATPVPAPTATPPPPPPPSSLEIDELPTATGSFHRPSDEEPAEVTVGADPASQRLEIAERQRGLAQALDVRVRDVDGVSVVTLTGPVDAALDGPELAARVGDVALFDLDGVEDVTDEGAAAIRTAFGALAERGVPVFLARCSEAVIARGAALWPEIGPDLPAPALVSLFAPYRCGGCGAAFSALYDVRAPGVLRAVSAATVPCPACEQAAVLDADPDRYEPLAPRAARRAPAPVVAIARGLPMREAPDHQRPPETPPRRAGTPHGEAGPPVSATSSGGPSRVAVPSAAASAVLVGAGGLAVVLVLALALVGAAAALRWALGGDAGLPAASAVAPAGGAGEVEVIPPLTVGEAPEIPPAWVETRLQVGEGTVFAVGRSEAADPAIALEQARADAVLALVFGLAQALQDAPAWAVIEPSLSPPLSPEASARAVARFEAHLFARAAGRQVARDKTWSREVGGKVELAARYSLERPVWDELIAAYREMAEFRSIRVGLLFPTMAARLPGEGQLVVVQTDEWDREARIGDVVVAVEEQPVRTVAQFADEADRAWQRAQAGRSVDVQVSSNGIGRELRFFKKGSGGTRGSPPRAGSTGRPLSSPR